MHTLVLFYSTIFDRGWKRKECHSSGGFAQLSSSFLAGQRNGELIARRPFSAFQFTVQSKHPESVGIGLGRGQEQVQITDPSRQI